ncbi:MAG: AI-2E family transporter [Planctomycetota bacterium]
MSSEIEQPGRLPPPWDRIFSLGTRTFVWVLLLAILYVLRPFLLLVFLTFVFAYIQAHGVDGLQHRIRNRPLRVTIVGLVFLGTIVATVLALAPQIEVQAMVLAKNYRTYITNADREINAKMREYPQVWDYLRKRESNAAALVEPGPWVESYSFPVELTGKQKQHKSEKLRFGELPPDLVDDQPHLVRDLVDSLLGLSGASEPHAPADSLRRVFDVGSSVFGYISSFLLSVLFSFLIVLDLPFLRRSLGGLARTKVGFIYDEVGGTIATFAKVLGRALEAQLFIAVANTILTSIGVWVLGIGNIPVLAAIVFVFSFIPVAGVFASSAPICLLALQDPTGGFSLMMAAIAMVLIVHGVETYILNPRIYGHHMRMNPVLVLIVLTVFGKLFGVWGFLLGIPLVNYIFRHAIRYPQDQPVDGM